MNRKRIRPVKRLVTFSGCIVLSLALLGGAQAVYADDPVVPKGWETGGEYDKNYNPNELDKFRAWVVAVREAAPMKGMAPGVVLEVKEGKDDDETILVHVCPSAYMGPKQIGLRRGDRVKVRGSWAFINDQDVFMAAKIKKGDYFELKVRLTSDGTPFWALTPEQLAQEKNAS